MILFLPLFSISQDFIVLKNSADTIYCKIIKDNITSIDYKLHESDTGTLNIKTSEIDYYLLDQYEMNDKEKQKYLNAFVDETKIQSLQKEYIEGFYRTFEEFKNNNPSTKGKIVKEYTRNKNIKRNYRLYVEDSSGQKIKYNNSWWGYSDGFIRYISKPVGTKEVFYTIHQKGNHYIFNQVKKHWIIIPVPYGGALVTWKKWKIKVIVNETGKIFRLNIKNLTKFNISVNEPLWEFCHYINSMSYEEKDKNTNLYYLNP